MALTCKISLSDLKIGDYVWCKYVATTSGMIGVFSDIATKTDADVSTALIPVVSSATPSGYFKFICVGKDYLGRTKLIAGQNIQHSISWDMLNSAGICSEKTIDLGLSVNLKSSIKLLTGGISSMDFDNEWDKTIVNSTLNNTITAGDNNIWNWSGISSWTSSNGTTSANRVIRGNATVYNTNAPTGLITTTVNTTTGFRPVLLIETLTIKKYLIKQNLNYYTVKLSNYDAITTHNFTQLVLTGGNIPTSGDIWNFGFDDISVLTNSMTVGSDIFVPISKFDNTAELKLYKV